MCGIAGIFHYGSPDKRVSRQELERMTRALAHRGPDGEGFHLDGPLGFGHRRLAIVDLSDAGSQPMSNEDGSLWINYNGEFYDHGSKRAALASRHAFRGTSDTETLLHLFAERGADCFQDIAAIFAVAFWSVRDRRLTLARDPLGVKQLYYHDDGRRLVFASEIKALLRCEGVPREIDPEAVNQYLHFHTPVFERTFFKGIRQLRAGELMEVVSSGARRRTYWSVREFTPRNESSEESVRALRGELSAVVRDQLMSDVPVGSFFSGGIDSSTVAAYAKAAGRPPRCFGVHFAEQGVPDERPYQEAAAKALGLELDLITLDGSSFPDDLARLMYAQDEPVIGAAMLPMYHVSKLAAGKVKVCLGGQAADEIFGGYSRYALARPWRVAQSWFQGRQKVKEGGLGEAVRGNLLPELIDLKTWRRIARNAPHLANWRSRYFENTAKVPASNWRSVFGTGEIFSREECRALFEDVLDRSEARDPATQVMHWDMQTYLTGLFHQDDRMSMAHGLESRVPLADPRLVRFAFRIPFHLKFRAGATKWILREAVSDAIPGEVLNRRKVGFATPAETWMKGPHLGFVRDVLLSPKARQRGIWNPPALQEIIDHPTHPFWFDILWKALCIETWASVFLDASRMTPADPIAPVELGAETQHAPAERTLLSRAREALEEARDLGVDGTLFRAQWELRLRTGAVERLERSPPKLGGEAAVKAALSLPGVLPFDAESVAREMRGRIPAASLSELSGAAADDAKGRILCFSRWIGDFGRPIDWHLNPGNGRRWNPRRHWSRALADESRVGDVKLTWEVGRFPQAYRMARAAAFDPELRAPMAEALASQIGGFVEANPYGRGVHWASGQEISIRIMSWLFAFSVLGRSPSLGTAGPMIVRAIHEGIAHIERYHDYARRAVYNNHLIAEALSFIIAGLTFSELPQAEKRLELGMAILDEQASRQFFADGGQFQYSHNYHRVVLVYYLWASALMKQEGLTIPRSWLSALEKSLDFLYPHQNPRDGRLPNFGANDGAMPAILSTCDFADFRPVLQAVSALTRGERLYEPGPWDEASAWLLGPDSLRLPLRRRESRSISFNTAGDHILRGDDPSSFSVFRCGTLRQRFSQMDMLALDVWWRGHNVLVDAGTYLYNGSPHWHDHFVRTGSHNTIQVDGAEQMLHYRRFKNLYWTRAKLHRFEIADHHAICEGEHSGYQRSSGCIHRRSVLLAADELWIVVDEIVEREDHRSKILERCFAGPHGVRLHWLGGEFPHRYSRSEGRLTLSTPEGPFGIAVFDDRGEPMPGDVAAGCHQPPRGWLSRHYGEKVPVPSLAVERRGDLPCCFVTVLSPGEAQVDVHGALWRVAAGETSVGFQLRDSQFEDVVVGGLKRRCASST